MRYRLYPDHAYAAYASFGVASPLVVGQVYEGRARDEPNPGRPRGLTVRRLPRAQPGGLLAPTRRPGAGFEPGRIGRQAATGPLHEGDPAL